MTDIMKKVIAGIVGVAVVGGAVAAFLMPEKVDVDTARRMAVEQSVSVTGNIAADEVETLYAPVDGRISTISIKPGEAVKASDIIATYDTTLIENEYEKANAALEATKEGYEAAVTENDKASSKYESAHAAEVSSRSEMESVLDMINALDIANRGDYLQPNDYSKALDLEANMKVIEQDTQISLTDKSAAEARLLEARGNERPYKEAYKDAKDVVNDLEDKLEDMASDDPARTVLEEQLDAAEEQMKTLKHRYDSVVDSIEDAENDVESATNKLYQDRAQLSSALSQLNDINKRNYDKTMSDEEYMQYRALNSRLELLQQDLTKSLTDRQYNESKLINDHTLEQYQHNVDMAEADVDSAEYTQDLAMNGIRASRGGVILDRFVDSNAMVEAGTPICTLQPMEGIKAEVMVSKYDIDKVAIGQEADITLGERSYTGVVSKIFPVAETDSSGKPKVKVWVEIDVSDNIPTIGLEAKVVIHTAMDREALAVPFDSVYTDEEGDYVYVLDGSHAEKRYIEIGIKGDDAYSVVDGINDGDTVIVTPFSDDRLKGRYSAKKQE